MTIERARGQAAATGASRGKGRGLKAAGVAAAVAGLALAGTSLWSEQQARGALAGMGATAHHIGVDPLSGRVSIVGAAIERDGMRISVGKVETRSGFALISPALAADPVVLTDVAIETPALTYRFPRIEITGATGSEAEVRALFDKNAKATPAARLAGFSAAQVVIPELVMTYGQEKDGNHTRVTYRDVKLTNVSNGVVASLTVGGGDTVTTAPEGKTTGTFGTMSAQAADMALMVRIYTEAAGPTDTVAKPVYAAFEMNDFTFVSPDKTTGAIKKISGANAKARPMRTPLAEIMKSLARVTDPDKLKPEERARYWGDLAELLGAFEIGSFEVVETTAVAQPDGASDDKAADKSAEKKAEDDAPEGPTKMRVGRMSFSAGGSANTFKMTDMEIAPPDGRVRIGSFALNGISGKPVIEALRQLEASAKAPDSKLDSKSLIGSVGQMRFDDIDADLAGEDDDAERVRMSLKNLVLASGPTKDGVPTSVQSSFEHLVVPISPNAEEAGLRDLLEMGFKNIDLSAALDGAWSESASELTISNLMLSAADMATINLKGRLGNVSKDVFSTDEAVAQAAIAGATIKSLSLSLINQGLAEKLADREARKDGGSAADIRKTYSSAAAVMLPAILGNSAQSKALAAAVGKFVASSGTLTIDATAKDSAGLGLSDFLAADGNPATLLERIDLKATAN